jgi:leucyl aminopeptidase
MFMTGVILGTHEDTRYKSEKKTPSLESLEFIGFGKGAELEELFKLSRKISEGVIFTRELVNSPANVLTPGI